MMARRFIGLAVACLMAVALLTACSSSPSKPAVCTDAANLKTSVQDLKNVNVRENGISAVSDQLTKIEQQFNTLKTDAKGQYSTQIDDMSKALSSLSSSVNAAKANVNAGTLSAVASAAGSVVTAGNNLVTAVSNTC
jgi:outer membrane biogenesis lipoprotein LolB